MFYFLFLQLSWPREFNSWRHNPLVRKNSDDLTFKTFTYLGLLMLLSQQSLSRLGWLLLIIKGNCNTIGVTMEVMMRASGAQGILCLLLSLCFVTKIYGNIKQPNPVPAGHCSDSSWMKVCIMIVGKKGVIISPAPCWQQREYRMGIEIKYL